MQVHLDDRAAFVLATAGPLTHTNGLIPALRASSNAPYSKLKEGMRGSSEGAQHQRMRNLIVVGEVALALVLLVGAALMLKSVWRLHQVDLGYQTSNTLTYRVELGWAA